MSTTPTLSPVAGEIPCGNATGFRRYFQQDFLSGFLVFLIALPLCLGISLASGFPPLAGIFTAIVGALIVPFISNSEMTIKGPAAGLIVIVLGCIEEFGGHGFMGSYTANDVAAYRAALAVGCVAALLQIGFALIRAGILGEFFPLSTVHGMLAAIGVIIITKQIPVALGSHEKIEPLKIFQDLWKVLATANPAIATIGIISLLIMFLWPLARKRFRMLNLIPAPVVVALVAVPMGMAFNLQQQHSYMIHGKEFELSEKYLVAMPDHMFGMFEKITFPDFTVLQQVKAWKWIFLFFVIGTLESVLSAKAVDLLDPWQRKTDIDRDVLAVGIANLCAAAIGGLPMISEIVRSKANIDNGARTRFGNFWHGVLLLVCVSLLPELLHLLPLAALAAMLIYTGFRLAHPTEFLHVYQIGREQLVIFVATLVGVLTTDLLMGVGIGIGVKLLIHLLNGVPLRSLFRAEFAVEPQGPDTLLIRPRDVAVFTNWIPFRRQLERIGLEDHKNVVLDVSDLHLIDHSVMDRLQDVQRDFQRADLQLEIVGLDAHIPLSSHAQSARKRGRPRMKRVTIYADSQLEPRLRSATRTFGIASYISSPCQRSTVHDQSGEQTPETQIRIELIVPAETSEEFLRVFRNDFSADEPLSVFVETIEAVR
jgi:MFS superfamily sulfate permease-like transporter